MRNPQIDRSSLGKSNGQDYSLPLRHSHHPGMVSEFSPTQPEREVSVIRKLEKDLLEKESELVQYRRHN